MITFIPLNLSFIIFFFYTHFIVLLFNFLFAFIPWFIDWSSLFSFTKLSTFIDSFSRCSTLPDHSTKNFLTKHISLPGFTYKTFIFASFFFQTNISSQSLYKNSFTKMSLERAFGESGAKHQARGVNPKYVKGISMLNQYFVIQF